MKCDERGNIWVTGPGGVWVFDPAGEHLGTSRCPRTSATSTGAAPDWNWLFIPAVDVRCTASGRKVAGIRPRTCS